MTKFLRFLEVTIFWFLIFLFVFIPLYPKFPLANISNTFVAIRLEDLFIALIISIWGIYLVLSKGLFSFFKNKLNQGLLLFFFIGILSSFSAIYLTNTVLSHLTMLHLLRRVELMMLLPLTIYIINSKSKLLISLGVLSIVLTIVNIYALGQQLLDWPVISTTNSEFSKGLILHLTEEARVNSTFAGHYDLAIFLAMSLVILTPLIFVIRKKLMKLLLLLLTLISFVVLIMTAARLSFVSAIIGIISSLILIGKKKFVVLILIAATLSLIYPSQLRDRFISTITINFLGGGQRYTPSDKDQIERHRLNIPTLSTPQSVRLATSSAISSGNVSDITPGEPVDAIELRVFRSFEIRLNLEWPRALNAFYKNPLLGTGYSSIGIATDNDFLRSLGEVGILGTFAFGLILIEIIKRVYSNCKDNDKLLRYFSRATLAMIFVFLLNAFFIDVFEASKVASLFWMILGLNLAIKGFK